MTNLIDFRVNPQDYQHWHVDIDDDIATLYLDVNEQGGLFDGYELKLNSYDLGVDIELADIVQRMRFEQPQVKTVVIRSGKDNVFCAGANIRMLGGASHQHKVNFCKFTNETRNGYEAALAESGQNYICAIQGACAGGGYEIALACNHIILTDDGASSVALPEVPLLAVLPGTGGLTRLTDKRKIRRDRADVFATLEEGIRGKKALEWGLVDEVVTNSAFDKAVDTRARELAGKVKDKHPKGETAVPKGIKLSQIDRQIDENGSLRYQHVRADIDRQAGHVTLVISGPDNAAGQSVSDLEAQGDKNWMLAVARQLDDAILHLRFNEPETGVIIFKTQGNSERVLAHEALLVSNRDHWLAQEILSLWKRVLKRIDLTSRSLVALVEPGSCFAGTLAELLFAVDRSYMALGEFDDDDRPEAQITLSPVNFGQYPMSNDLTRLQTRFPGAPQAVEEARVVIGEPLGAEDAERLGLVTFAYDDIDWEDEIRVFLEERASFSADALTGMEANLRFTGPETMETRIFGRLSAWQNWIFQRPNAVGEKGALKRYGSGLRGEYDKTRV